jgi:hypothetical protein
MDAAPTAWIVYRGDEQEEGTEFEYGHGDDSGEYNGWLGCGRRRGWEEEEGEKVMHLRFDPFGS